MFTRNQFSLLILLTAGVIFNFYTLVAANDADDMIHCKGEEIVTGQVMGEIQKNCSIELHSTPENTSCISVCMLKHYGAVDETGLPTKEKFDKMVDEKVAADLRDKLKKTNCFDHATKIEKGAEMCNSLKEFEGCFDKLMMEICKN